ncbi:calcium-regulated heat-stable protein 1 isoform X2 [Cynocephalus volans]
MSSEPPPPSQPPTHQVPVGLLDTPRARERSPSPLRGNVVPSPLPTRRTRTFSATVRASQGPVYKGVCKCFCRSKGHGFITPADGGPDIFLHISDVEGEYVPVEGDEVTYKMCSIPPKNEKLQAVEPWIVIQMAPRGALLSLVYRPHFQSYFCQDPRRLPEVENLHLHPFTTALSSPWHLLVLDVTLHAGSSRSSAS